MRQLHFIWLLYRTRAYWDSLSDSGAHMVSVTEGIVTPALLEDDGLARLQQHTREECVHIYITVKHPISTFFYERRSTASTSWRAASAPNICEQQRFLHCQLVDNSMALGGKACAGWTGQFDNVATVWKAFMLANVI